MKSQEDIVHVNSTKTVTTWTWNQTQQFYIVVKIMKKHLCDLKDTHLNFMKQEVMISFYFDLFLDPQVYLRAKKKIDFFFIKFSHWVVNDLQCMLFVSVHYIVKSIRTPTRITKIKSSNLSHGHRL